MKIEISIRYKSGATDEFCIPVNEGNSPEEVVVGLKNMTQEAIRDDLRGSMTLRGGVEDMHIINFADMSRMSARIIR